MKLTWRPAAVEQLGRIIAYIARDNPAAGDVVEREILQMAELVAC